MKSANIWKIKEYFTLTICLLVAACGGSVVGFSVAPITITGNTGTLSALTYIPYNSSTTITWSSSVNADCTLTGAGTTGASGTTGKTGVFVTPLLKTDTDYTLRCADVSQSITIHVASSATASSITAFAAGTGGVTTVITLNSLSNGTQISINGTTSYNGTYTVANQTSTSFDIAPLFVSGTQNGTGSWQLAGGMIYGCSTTATQGNLGAIDLTSYTVSRFKGVAPLSVFFDASGTITDGSVPIIKDTFHDIEYQWNFGDYSDPINKVINPSPPVGSPSPDPITTTWSMGSKPGANSRNAATGPVATHVFETPGVYTVALTANDGINKVSNSCAQIVVQDPNIVFSGANTICFSGASGAAAFAGCPANATHITLPIISPATTPDFGTAVNSYIGTGKRLLFHAGEVYSGAASAIIGVNGPGIIGMYGTGAKPKIQSTATNVIQLGTPKAYTTQDWRIMDLEIDGQSNTNLKAFGVDGIADQVTLQRLNVHDIGNGVILDGSILEYYMGANGYLEHMYDQFSIVDSSFTNILGYGLYIFANKLAILGTLVDDNPTQGIHVVRVMHSTKGVVSNNTFGHPSLTHQVFTLRAPSYTDCRVGHPDCEYFPNLLPGNAAITSQVVVSDNKFIDGLSNQPVTIGPSNAQVDDGRLSELLYERNWYTGASSQCCWSMLNVQAKNVTVRNEIIDLTGAGLHLGMAIGAAGTNSQASDNVRVYNNTIFSNDSGDFSAVRVQAGTTNITVVNTLAYSPNISGYFIDPGWGTPTTASNNTTVTNKSPLMAVVPPIKPADFAVTTGSYAISAGIVAPVWSDFFSSPSKPTRNMGAIQGP
jgi:hypothetical protein